MAPTSSRDLHAEERTTLLEVARRSIAHGADHGRQLVVQLQDYDHRLSVPRGCFVTLHRRQTLRGCVGSLRPRGPLVSEVARTAFLAAFCDPRFSAVAPDEVDDLHVHISVLGEPERVAFTSEAELVEKLRPHVDGVILTKGAHLGTFLPEVWSKFPEPRDFLQHLKVKAGLSADYWSDEVEVERYTTQGFG